MSIEIQDHVKDTGSCDISVKTEYADGLWSWKTQER